MPGKIAVAHHTLADWDFEQGAEHRELADDFFVSPPSSLKYNGTAISFTCTILCRIPSTLVLPQGEIRTWVRATAYYRHPALFRQQAPLGTANLLNGYLIVLWDNLASLGRNVDGVYSVPDSTPCYMAYNEWGHYRFVWYNGITPAEVPALCVDVYYEDAGEWVKQGDTLYDTDNYWKDSEINRCGLYVVLYLRNKLWYDDTEIWGPV